MVDKKIIKKIKELYRNGRYEEIALFVKSGFKIHDILRWYGDLNEAEVIITAISCFLYGKKDKDNQDNLDDEMFLLAELDEGIKELIDSNNTFFKENIDSFIDYKFLNNCTNKSILALYDMGYRDLIIKGVLKYKINSIYLIEELLSIEEFKNKIITKEFLLHGFNSRYEKYFLNLPKDRRNLLSYYGVHVFGNDNYSGETCMLLKDNLFYLYKNNFPELSEDLIKIIIDLYGKVSFGCICYVINNIIVNNNYLNEMQIIANRFFKGQLEVVLSFSYKYPNLSSILFELDKIDINTVKKIYELSASDVLDGINELSIDEFIKSDIKDFSYSFDIEDNINNYNNISPVNIKKNIFLFNYYREIARIDTKGNWEEYLVRGLHYEALKEIYDSDKDNKDLLYEANIIGDVLFVIENAGMIMWLPFVMTEIQKKVLLEKLNNLKDKQCVDIYIGIANPNKNNYIFLNNGMPVNVGTAIEDVKRIKVDNIVKNKVLKS